MSAVKVLVTGATGFVGRHLVAALLQRGFEVRAVARNLEAAQELPWFDDVEFIAADIHASDVDIDALIQGVDTLAHLAWPGLPNYDGLFHFERNLPSQYAFIQRVVQAGVQQVLVTGTCFEYGLQNGPLAETTLPQPSNPYGLAKDCLRRYLESLSRVLPFTLQWARLFYLHGEGQNPMSLLASLDRAINANDVSFDMSAGEQLRDYLAVEAAAGYLAQVLQRTDFAGVINICSGHPVSVRTLVEQRLASSGSTMKLNLGVHGYSIHEPMAFWGNPDRLQQLVGARHGS